MTRDEFVGVLNNAIAGLGFDPAEVTVYGFGLGIERMAMVLRGIDNIHDLWG